MKTAAKPVMTTEKEEIKNSRWYANDQQPMTTKNMTPRLHLLLLVCLFSCAVKAQDTIPAYSHYYQFNNYFIDLNTFERVDKIAFPAQGWKYASKFAPRYQRLSIDKMGFRGKLFEIMPNNALKMVDMSTQASVLLPNKEAAAERAGQNFLISCRDGALFVKHLSPDLGFRVYKYDVTGSEVFGVGIPHSRLVKYAGGEYHRPYLRYFGHTGWEVVFSSYDKETPKTFVLNAATGKLQEFNFTMHGFIRDEKEDNFVQGFVYWSEQDKEWRINYQGNEFSVQLPSTDLIISSFEPVLNGNVLYLAAYSVYRPGCQLWAFDLQTRQWLWKTTVPTPAPASDAAAYYYNTVWLSLREGMLLLEGFEKDGKYFCVFDTATGKMVRQF